MQSLLAVSGGEAAIVGYSLGVLHCVQQRCSEYDPWARSSLQSPWGCPQVQEFGHRGAVAVSIETPMAVITTTAPLPTKYLDPWRAPCPDDAAPCDGLGWCEAPGQSQIWCMGLSFQAGLGAQSLFVALDLAWGGGQGRRAVCTLHPAHGPGPMDQTGCTSLIQVAWQKD